MIRRLQPELAKVPGITLYMQSAQGLTVEDRVTRTQFQYTLEHPNVDELNNFAPKMLAALQKLPKVRDVASDQANQGLQAKVIFDRETAYRLGITPAAIDQTLYDAYGQRLVSTMFTQLNQYHVVLEVKLEFKDNPLDLRHLFIRTGMGSAGSQGLVGGGSGVTQLNGPTSSLSAALASLSATSPGSSISATIPSSAVFGGQPVPSTAAFPNGGQVPLAAFTHVVTTTAPVAIDHQGQFPVVTLSFNLAPGASLGEAVDAINRVKQELGLPASIQAAFQGTAQAGHHRADGAPAKPALGGQHPYAPPHGQCLADGGAWRRLGCFPSASHSEPRRRQIASPR